MRSNKQHIVVIGGGIAGTAAAHSLVKAGYVVTIVERQDRLGGRVYSRTANGVTIEMGAGFLTEEYTNIWNFIQKSELSNLLYAQKSVMTLYKDGCIHALSLHTLLTNAVLSWRSKAHALPLFVNTLRRWRMLDFRDPQKAAKIDTQAVTQIYNTRGGRDFMENVLQPILNGYFYWTPEHTSQAMLYTLCKIVFRYTPYKMQGGLQRIPEMAAQGSEVLLGANVQTVSVGVHGRYSICFEHEGAEKVIEADGIVCATTASAVPKIFPNLNSDQLDFFNSVCYSSTALLAQVFKTEQGVDTQAIAIPRNQGIGLASVTLSSESASAQKNSDSVVTMKAYVSGEHANGIITRSDTELTEWLLNNAASVAGGTVTGQKTASTRYLQKWPEALPHFDVGHIKRIASFRAGAIEDQDQMIVFAGDYIGGPFIEGAFTSGVQAAQRLCTRLEKE